MSLTDQEKVSHYVEMWKQTVTVQQHFNDIEWRIRGLALTAVTFAVGAAAVAAKDGQSWAGTVVLLVGLLLWYAFYFVDRYWYHPLLKASVKQGEKLEDELVLFLPSADLTKTISAGSPIPRPRMVRIMTLGFNRDQEMHSEHKLVWFYRIGALALFMSAIALGTIAALSDTDAQDKPIIVKLEPEGVPSPVSPAPTPTMPTRGP